MKRTVLVVDDDADIAETLEIALESEGYAVVKASNGQEGLDLLARSLIDVVVVDLMMPVMDGREMARRMRASDAFRRIPIVIMSAASVRDPGCPADAFIRKPFGIEEIGGVVSSLFGGHAPAA